MMSRGWMKPLAAVVPVVAILIAVALRTRRRGPWKPLWQPPAVPRLVRGRSYFWLTHHKTGTNLMQRFCNITAIHSTGWRDECAFCVRLRRSARGIDCVPDWTPPSQGKLRGTVDRFTLLSSIHSRELKLIHEYSSDFRAVHMIRHPVAMAISAHQYNKFVSSPEGRRSRWDMSAQAIENATSLREELLIEARAIIRPIRDMASVHELMKHDPRVLTLDLDLDFEETYGATSERLFRHIFDNATGDLGSFVKHAADHDKRSWSLERKRLETTAAPRYLLDRTRVLEEWRKLAEEGHPDVLRVISFAQPLGYQREWAPGAEAAHAPRQLPSAAAPFSTD